MHQEEEKEEAEYRQTGGKWTNKNQGKEWDVRLFLTQELPDFFTLDRDFIRMLAVDIKRQIPVGTDQRGSLSLY